MRKRVLVLLSMSLVIVSTLVSGCANQKFQTVPIAANKYPEKPITVIVPFNPGGGLDLTARSLEKLALKHLGQPLVVVNKPGGAGALGWNELSGSAADGYTAGITGIDLLLLPQYGASKYNYLTALDPLAQIAALPTAIAVKADQPWQNIDELIAYARQHPKQLKFGHSGIGSFSHLVGEMFGQAANISIEQVPFAGASEVIPALLGGHVQIIINTPSILKEHAKAGTVRILAVTGDHRSGDPELKQIPTFKEQGLDITLTNWYGIAVPKELPVKDRNKLAAGLKSLIADPEFKTNMENIGIPVEYLGPEETQAKWLADNEKLRKTMQDSGVLEQIKAQKK